MYRLLEHNEAKRKGDEFLYIDGCGLKCLWAPIRASSEGSKWLDGDLPVRRKIEDEAEVTSTDTGSPELHNIIERLKAVQCMVSNGCDDMTDSESRCAYDELDFIIAQLRENTR